MQLHRLKAGPAHAPWSRHPCLKFRSILISSNYKDFQQLSLNARLWWSSVEPTKSSGICFEAGRFVAPSLWPNYTKSVACSRRTGSAHTDLYIPQTLVTESLCEAFTEHVQFYAVRQNAQLKAWYSTQPIASRYRKRLYEPCFYWRAVMIGIIAKLNRHSGIATWKSTGRIDHDRLAVCATEPRQQYTLMYAWITTYQNFATRTPGFLPRHKSLQAKYCQTKDAGIQHYLALKTR